MSQKVEALLLQRKALAELALDASLDELPSIHEKQAKIFTELQKIQEYKDSLGSAQQAYGIAYGVTAQPEPGVIGRSDSATYTQGDPVSWTWGEGTATGTIAGVFPRRVQRTIEGSRITRNGTPDNPALLIEQENGAKALKLASEVRRGDALPKPQPL